MGLHGRQWERIKLKMLINEKNLKMWATIGQRATLGIAALELAKENDNLIVLTADVST